MECRLALVRHGPSAHVHQGWVDSAGFRAWRTAYEAAGLEPGAIAPPSLTDLGAQAGLVLASDAPRARASAERLAPGREIVSSPLLRELELAAPELGRWRLPLRAWGLAVWLRNRRLIGSPAEERRLDEAAAWLDPLADRHPLIIVVTHAAFRSRLAEHLVSSGWRPEPGRSWQPWSVWRLRRTRSER